ncbi:MAG: protein kinase [Planctomycetota bacterium]
MHRECPHCHASLPAALFSVAGKPSCPECGETLPFVAEGEAPQDVAASGGRTYDPDRDDPLLQKILGGCRLERLVGRGSMASVYQATKLNLDMTVAVKVIRREVCHDEQVLQRFQQEARTVAKFHTAHVVRVLDVGYDTAQRVHFLVMEYVDDGTLRDYALSQNRQGLDATDAVSFLEQACRALLEAKKLSIIHRDIKPENLLLSSTGTVKVADFGLSKIHGATLNMTDPGQLMGTPLYASPEQCRAQELDFRSDIYSLGASFYYLLTGLPPAEGSTFYKILDTKSKTSFLSPAKAPLDKRIPGPISQIIEKMTALDKEDRYGSIEELIEDCKRVFRGEAPLATPPPQRPVTGMLARPRKPAASARETQAPEPEERHPLDRRPRLSDARQSRRTVPVLKYAILLLVVIGLAWGGYSVLAKGDGVAARVIEENSRTASGARSYLANPPLDDQGLRSQLTRVDRAIRRVERVKDARGAMALLQQLRGIHGELTRARKALERRDTTEFEQTLASLESARRNEAELPRNFEELGALAKRVTEKPGIDPEARKELEERIRELEASYRKSFRTARIRPLEGQLKDLEARVKSWNGNDAELDSIHKHLKSLGARVRAVPACFQELLGELPVKLDALLDKVGEYRKRTTRLALLHRELQDLGKLEKRAQESTLHGDFEQLLEKAELVSGMRKTIAGSLPADLLAEFDRRQGSIRSRKADWDRASAGFEQRLDGLRERIESHGPALLGEAIALQREVDEHRPGMRDQLKSDVAKLVEKIRTARPARTDPRPDPDPEPEPPVKPGSITSFAGRKWILPEPLRGLLEEVTSDGGKQRSFRFTEKTWEEGNVMVLIGGRELANGQAAPPFLMDKYVVSYGRFLRYLAELKANKAPIPDVLYEAKSLFRDSEDAAALPAVGYDLNAARGFAARLQGRSLPSSDEWEFAAVGDSGNKYPWGNTPHGHESWKKVFLNELPRVEAYERENAAREKDVSPFGVVGLASGVAEWCELSEPDPERGVIRGVSHVREPGGRNHQAKLARTIQDARSESLARRKRLTVGFRCIIRLEESN